MNDRSITYRVVFRRRRSLGLYVLDSGEVELRLPLRCPMSVGEEFVRSRRAWLARALAGRRRAIGPPAVDYADGAQVPVLGRPRQLLLRRSAEPLVVCSVSSLLVRAPSLEAGVVYAALVDWYRQLALADLATRLAEWAPRLSLPQPEMRVRRMRARWGSCSSAGRLSFNLWLLRAPPECIDYVVVHELCHLHAFNHSPAFHALVASVLPDWRERQALLRDHQRLHGVAARQP